MPRPANRPPFVAKRVLSLSLLLWCLPSGAQSPAAVREAPPHAKQKLLDQINADRRAHGLQPVTYSEELSRVADEHCREMLQHDYSSHWNRAGWKPYLRYTQAGLQDYTSENIASAWSTNLDVSEAGVLRTMLDSHARLMDEKPPNDGHRRSVLTAGHQTVGIGVAFYEKGLRMIEVFGRREVELRGAPKTAELTASSSIRLRARFLRKNLRVKSVSIFYEPLPQPMSRDQLSATYSYSLPDEEHIDRPFLGDRRYYVDGSPGDVIVDPGVGFSMPVRFWKGQPGIYTLAVWLAAEGSEPFIGGMTTIIVER